MSLSPGPLLGGVLFLLWGAGLGAVVAVEAGLEVRRTKRPAVGVTLLAAGATAVAMGGVFAPWIRHGPPGAPAPASSIAGVELAVGHLALGCGAVALIALGLCPRWPPAAVLACKAHLLTVAGLPFALAVRLERAAVPDVAVGWGLVLALEGHLVGTFLAVLAGTAWRGRRRWVAASLAGELGGRRPGAS